MPDFMIAYHGQQKPPSPEEGQAAMARWQKWIGDLGDAVVNPGTPLGGNKSVGDGGVSDYDASVALSGFSVVSADDMDAALEIAKACPFLEMGTLEVAQIMKMGG